MRLAEVARLAGSDWGRAADVLVDGEQAVRLAALYDQWKPLMSVGVKRLRPPFLTGADCRVGNGGVNEKASCGDACILPLRGVNERAAAWI